MFLPPTKNIANWCVKQTWRFSYQVTYLMLFTLYFLMKLINFLIKRIFLTNLEKNIIKIIMYSNMTLTFFPIERIKSGTV